MINRLKRREVMNRYFDHLVSVVLEYRGTVDKFIVDEIMVLFGRLKADEKHPNWLAVRRSALFVTNY